MFKDLPFTVSPSAMAYLEETMREIEATSKFAGLATTLSWSCNETHVDSKGRVLSRFPGEFFSIGLQKPDLVSDNDRFWLGGAEVAIDSDTLERLKGTNLELDESPGGPRLVARRY
jgi:hypothetical protein